MEWIFYIAAGSLLGTGAVSAWNRMPAEWLCDYGEQAGEAQREKHLSMGRWGFVFSVVFTICTAGAVKRGMHSEDSLFIIPALWLLLLILLSDAGFMIIPDQLTLGIAALGAVAGMLEMLRGEPASCALAARIAGAAVCGGLFLFLGGISSLLCRSSGGAGGFGMGDVKLLFALGFLLGPAEGLTALGAASILCGAAAAVLWLTGRIEREDPHPFGPYLCAAAAAVLMNQ